MKVRILNQISGTMNGVEWPKPGEVVDVSDELGKTLIEQKNAIGVKGEGPETATTPAASKRKSRSTMKRKR